MKHYLIKNLLNFLLLVFLFGIKPGLAQPIRLNPENHHYFEYKGKPIVLVTSAMHYGAVSNLDMHYDQYLEILGNYGFNHHREFIIPCYEWQSEDKWETEQTPLSPRPGKLLSPYARSSVPGANDGLNKFDLNKWNPEYFDHLKDFCRKADEKGIVIEIVLFTVLYGEGFWETNPFCWKNNINDVGKGHYNDYTFFREAELVERQKQLVQKVVNELNEFDNVYYEICNEPYWANGLPWVNPEVKDQHFLPEVNEWQSVIAKTIAKTEKELSQKHLIAQNFANDYYKIDTVCHPTVSVLNFHYAFPPRAVPDNYHLNLPLSFDETHEGCEAPNRRIEAWAFMLSGGAVYSNLDWSFAIDDQSGRGRNPAGKRRSGLEVKQQLHVLKKFLDGFDYIQANPVQPDRILNLPDEISFWGLENDKEIAVYFLKRNVCEADMVSFNIISGDYKLTWIDPLDGSVISSLTSSVKGDTLLLNFPGYMDDLLLKLQRMDK